MLEFNSSPGPTIGVELELQLIHSETCHLLNIAPEVLKRVDQKYRQKIKEEFLKSMIEINTGICETISEVEQDLRESLEYLKEILKPFDATFFSASLHPFARGSRQSVTDNLRYKQIMEDLQIVGRRFIAQGLHVHIGVKGPEEAIQITNTIRIYLPLLLALTTSSPFYEGEKTGLLSYRTKLFEALPRSGMPEYIDGWHEFNHLVLMLMKAGYIETVKDLWWDVRPHPDFGTVEIRICDIPCRFRDILAIAAFVQSIVVHIGNLPHHPKTYIQIHRANKWQAARYGLDGVFANPISSGIHPIRNAILDLLKLIQNEADSLGCSGYLRQVEKILEKGTGAHRQLELFRQTSDLREVIKTIQGEFFL